MPKIKNAQQMLDIILPIPEDKIVIGTFYDGDGKGCFIGQINNALYEGQSTEEKERFDSNWDGYGARQLTKRFLKEKHDIDENGAHVNNYPGVNGYNEDTPKARVVHMLQDMVASGY